MTITPPCIFCHGAGVIGGPKRHILFCSTGEPSTKKLHSLSLHHLLKRLTTVQPPQYNSSIRWSRYGHTVFSQPISIVVNTFIHHFRSRRMVISLAEAAYLSRAGAHVLMADWHIRSPLSCQSLQPLAKDKSQHLARGWAMKWLVII